MSAATAAAAKLAGECGIDLADVEPTGAGGRITIGDVRKARDAQLLPPDERERFLDLVRGGSAVPLLLEDFEIPPREWMRELRRDPELEREVLEAEAVARARLSTVLYADAIENEDATSARAWEQLNDPTRPRRAGEAWHSGDPDYAAVPA